MRIASLVPVVFVALTAMGCGGSGGARLAARGVYSAVLQLPGGKHTRVVVDLTNAAEQAGLVRLYDSGSHTSGKLTGTITNNSVALTGSLPPPYGRMTVSGTITGNTLEGTVTSEAFPSTRLSATTDTALSPYLGWVKIQFQGPGSVSGTVPGFWVQADNEKYVAFDCAYIPDPNNHDLTNAFGVAIYTGGSQWFAMMRWSNNVDSYDYQALLLPGSNEIQLSVISDNQIIVEGSGTYTLSPYTP